MPLEQFITYMQEKLKSFEVDWKVNEKHSPEDYSQDGMDLADWLEQFEMFEPDFREE